MAKKHDRFERMVLAAMKKQDTPDSPGIWLNGPDVVKLLRMEHKAVVEIVENEEELPGTMPDEMWDTIRSEKQYAEEAMRIVVRQTKQNILDRLNEGAK